MERHMKTRRQEDSNRRHEGKEGRHGGRNRNRRHEGKNRNRTVRLFFGRDPGRGVCYLDKYVI